MAVSAPAIDPRLRRGAYVHRDGTLWQVLGHATDENGAITGDYVLENAIGERSASGTYVYKRILIAPNALALFELAREAPSVEVPAHLDEQLTEHCKEAGL